MELSTVLKIVHVLAAIVAIGANVTYAVWLRHAGLDPIRLPFVIRGIRRVERTLANPAYIVVLLSGVAMIVVGPFSISAGWVQAALGLYAAAVLIGVFLFAPALRRQLAEAERAPQSMEYAAAARRSNTLGVLTVTVVLVIIWLMVAKPF